MPPHAPAIRTTCPYCGVGCGVLATPDGKGGAAIAGDPDHPANFGRLCSKGSALGETLGLETRLLHPEIGGRRVGWDEAIDHVASRIARTAEVHGPEAIAFYLSGQLLTEDYYVANKLAKGFIGTPHVDTNSRLCMASSVAGHRRAFGADIVPQCYDDLELADLVVLVGSNAAWCHPVLYQRIQVARAERGVRVVNIDPRRTATSEGADLHLAIRPGTDTQLWNGLLCWLSDYGALDRRFIDEHTEGFAAALASARMAGRTRRPGRARHRPRQRRHRAVLLLVDDQRAGRHLLFAGREPVGASAPTRSTPSSIATWPPAASASPERGRCRSPASPTPWAGARSAGSPTCWPRTWASRRPSATACAASGTRRT